jgi:predicted MFS family arabinose efflux permease
VSGAGPAASIGGGSGVRSRAVRFVVLVGVMSLFADFTYEGMRGIAGPYLALLGASATAVGVVAGLGELLGYGLRVVSGRLSDRTRAFWPITIVGYVVQMAAVPALALAGSWPAAAALIVLERIGKATRNPPRDVMLSHAAREMGYGWAFGVHEALDQLGALLGPLVIAAVLGLQGDYRTALAWLALPAGATLLVLAAARILYPRPEELDSSPPDVRTEGLPPRFWWYLAAAALVAAGFADFPLIAFRFAQSAVVSPPDVPLLYALAMGTSGAASLVFGRLFDRAGLRILVPLTVVSAAFAPLVFIGGPGAAVVGIALWGMGMGVHESIIPAAVATMVRADQRASAYGLFTAGYGIAWFAGSAAMGVLYDAAFPAMIALSVALELAAIPILVRVARSAPPKPAR